MFSRQLADTLKRLATTFHKGHARLAWVKPNGKRNEALDCFVYAYAGAVYLGVARMRENDWDRREQKVQPREMDLFSQPQPAQLQVKTGSSAYPESAGSYGNDSDTRPEDAPAAMSDAALFAPIAL